MDQLTLEVLAANEPNRPITRTGTTLFHAHCYADLVHRGHASEGWLPCAAPVTYGFATGRQCIQCGGFFEE